MKTSKIIYLSIIASFLTACSKDFLELKPQGMLFEENFYSNKEEIYEGLIAAYDLTAQKYTAAYTYHSSYMMRNIASDDANCGGGNALDMLVWQEIDEFNAKPGNESLLAHWYRSYFGIYRCNQIITRVNPSDITLHQVPSDSIILKRYVAEAKFLRAYYNYELVTFFGGIPIVSTLLTVADPYPARASLQDSWSFIEKDLIDAIPNLPLKSQQGSHEYQRASRGAAQSMLGKVYLFQKKYDEAALVLEDVIQSRIYDFDPAGYARNFTPDGDFNVESIYELSHSSSSAADWTANNSRSFEGNVDCQLMGVRELSGSSVYNPGWGFNKAELSLVNLFIQENDWIRMNASIYSTDSVRASEAVSVTWNSDYKYTGWYCNKFAPKKANQGDGIGASELDYNANEKIIRYPDVLLMAAEAHMFKSSPEEAKTREYINLVRGRVSLPEISASLSGSDLFNALVKERRLELAMEGQRYFDLVRWGLAPSILVNQPVAPSNTKGSFIEGKHEVFPIPFQEIERSGGVLQQNDGYF
jgi:starch-binding outer membrane protein, SusD/RagB family